VNVGQGAADSTAYLASLGLFNPGAGASQPSGQQQAPMQMLVAQNASAQSSSGGASGNTVVVDGVQYNIMNVPSPSAHVFSVDSMTPVNSNSSADPNFESSRISYQVANSSGPSGKSDSKTVFVDTKWQCQLQFARNCGSLELQIDEKNLQRVQTEEGEISAILDSGAQAHGLPKQCVNLLQWYAPYDKPRYHGHASDPAGLAIYGIGGGSWRIDGLQREINLCFYVGDFIVPLISSHMLRQCNDLSDYSVDQYLYDWLGNTWLPVVTDNNKTVLKLRSVPHGSVAAGNHGFDGSVVKQVFNNYVPSDYAEHVQGGHRSKVKGFVCPVCVAAAMKHDSMDSGAWLEQLEKLKPNEIVCVDLGGPYPESPGGYTFAGVGADIKSLSIAIACLKGKTDAGFHVVKNYVDCFERRSPHKVQFVYPDNEAALVGGDKLKSFLTEKGIRMLLTRAGRKGGHAYAELALQRVQRKSRQFLLESGLKMSCWPLTYQHGCMILMQTPSKSRDGKTPAEILELPVKEKDVLVRNRAFGTPCVGLAYTGKASVGQKLVGRHFGLFVGLTQSGSVKLLQSNYGVVACNSAKSLINLLPTVTTLLSKRDPFQVGAAALEVYGRNQRQALEDDQKLLRELHSIGSRENDDDDQDQFQDTRASGESEVGLQPEEISLSAAQQKAVVKVLNRSDVVNGSNDGVSMVKSVNPVSVSKATSVNRGIFSDVVQPQPSVVASKASSIAVTGRVLRSGRIIVPSEAPIGFGGKLSAQSSDYTDGEKRFLKEASQQAVAKVHVPVKPGSESQAKSQYGVAQNQKVAKAAMQNSIAKSSAGAKNGTQDFWEEDQHAFIRVHVIARRAMCTPTGIKGCPNVHLLSGERQTIVRYVDGNSATINDRWDSSSSHYPLDNLWTGRTRFLKKASSSSVSGAGMSHNRFSSLAESDSDEPADPVSTQKSQSSLSFLNFLSDPQSCESLRQESMDEPSACGCVLNRNSCDAEHWTITAVGDAPIPDSLRELRVDENGHLHRFRGSFGVDQDQFFVFLEVGDEFDVPADRIDFHSVRVPEDLKNADPVMVDEAIKLENHKHDSIPAWTEATTEEVRKWKEQRPLIPVVCLLKGKPDEQGNLKRIKARFVLLAHVLKKFGPNVSAHTPNWLTIMIMTTLDCIYKRVVQIDDAESAFINSVHATQEDPQLPVDPDTGKRLNPVAILPAQLCPPPRNPFRKIWTAVNGLSGGPKSYENRRDGLQLGLGYSRNERDPSVMQERGTHLDQNLDPVTPIPSVEQSVVINHSDDSRESFGSNRGSLANIQLKKELKLVTNEGIHLKDEAGNSWWTYRYLGVEWFHPPCFSFCYFGQLSYISKLKSDISRRVMVPLSPSFENEYKLAVVREETTPQSIKDHQAHNGLCAQFYKSGRHLAYSLRRLGSAKPIPTTISHYKKFIKHVTSRPWLCEVRPVSSKTSSHSLYIRHKSDSDFAAESCGRSVSSSVVSINNVPVVCRSTKQSIVVASVGEAELVAMSSATKDGIAVEQQVHSLNFVEKSDVSRSGYADSKSSLEITTGSGTLNKQSKHLDVKCLSVREDHRRGAPYFHVSTDRNDANVNTKCLPRVPFETGCQQLGVHLLDTVPDFDIDRIADSSYVGYKALPVLVKRFSYLAYGHGDDEDVKRDFDSGLFDGFTC